MGQPMAERWLPVPGYQGLYEVSDLGRVWSCISGRFLKPALRGRRNRQYLFVLLHDNGKRRSWYVHTLVLLAFCGPRPQGLMARHLDDVATHNVLTNLVWGTDSENKRDAVLTGHNRYSARTHCPQGHPWSPENTRWYRGYRCCRQCKRESEAARNADPVIGAEVRKRRRDAYRASAA